MTSMQASKAPRSFTKLQGDDDFKGAKVPEALFYSIPTHLAQQQRPWHALGGHHTLSSARHQRYHFDPSAPSDDLDLVIKSSYDHQRDLFKTKREVVICRPDFCENKNRELYQNRVKSQPAKTMPLNHPLIVRSQSQKEDINSLKTTIGGIHIHATRHGYHSQPDTGGFFL